MNQIYMVYKTDAHHSYTSRDLIGVATFKSTAIIMCTKKAILEDEEISLEQLDLLITINQTQGYKGDGEFVIEPIEVNKLL